MSGSPVAEGMPVAGSRWMEARATAWVELKDGEKEAGEAGRACEAVVEEVSLVKRVKSGQFRT